jgi:large subunit GTPase 1
MLIGTREAWADYFEQNGVDYAFFSAMDAAAAQEQIDKRIRRELGLDEEDTTSDSEEGGVGEDVEGADEIGDVSGEEVESEEDVDDGNEDAEGTEDEEDKEDDEERLMKGVQQTTMEDYEEGWSTEGEDDDEEEGETGKKLANGQAVPLWEIARDMANQSNGEVEDIRTRVLTVAELEELFQNAAPDLSGELVAIARYTS